MRVAYVKSQGVWSGSHVPL